MQWAPASTDLWAPDSERRRAWASDSDGHLTLIQAIDLFLAAKAAESISPKTATWCEGGLFALNGAPLYLRLVLSQGYWPQSHLAAPSDEALRAEVEWIKRLGFNGVRIHQKVEDPRFLYWCDRLGVVVWSEMASAYVFSDLAPERFVREWLEVIRRDHNHPSIVTWVPFNERWGVPDLPNDPAHRDLVRSLYHLTKALDPSRPAVGNDGWEHVTGDILGIHDYAVDGATLGQRYGNVAGLEETLAQLRRRASQRWIPTASPGSRSECQRRSPAT